MRQYILFHGQRNPEAIGEAEVREFPTLLAADREVAPGTQNLGFNALLFLYREVLGRPPGDLSGILRGTRPKKAPVVKSPLDDALGLGDS